MNHTKEGLWPFPPRVARLFILVSLSLGSRIIMWQAVQKAGFGLLSLFAQ